MFTVIAFVLFVIAAALAATTNHHRWWPVFACAGLALLALTHGVDFDLDLDD